MSRVAQSQLTLPLAEEFGHEDVTDQLSAVVAESGITNGIAVVALVGSTGAVTTIEYESGALAALRAALDALAPTDRPDEHNSRWGDGNGFSHVRSALLKTSIAIPVVAGQIQLGTWQQVVVINVDNRPRRREVVLTVIGE